MNINSATEIDLI